MSVASVGAAMGSGFRGRTKADSPASGVRAAQNEPALTPPVAPLRLPLESDPGLTRIGMPDPSLLALSRGEPGKQSAPDAPPGPRAESKPKPRRLLWFLFGLLVGGVAVWSATSDVAEDVYRARMWAARTLRAAGGHPDAPQPGPGPEPVAAPAAIPTVDVSELPRAKEEKAQGASTGAAAAPPSPGAPALENAPGPK
jgi:hypothetical protein